MGDERHGRIENEIAACVSRNIKNGAYWFRVVSRRRDATRDAHPTVKPLKSMVLRATRRATRDAHPTVKPLKSMVFERTRRGYTP